MKSILLPLTSHVAHEAVTRVASNLAQQFRATLTGLFVRPDPRSAIPFMGEGLTAEMIQTLCDNAEREGRLHAEAAEKAFTEAMGACGIKIGKPGEKADGAKAVWRVITGDIGDIVGRSARTADLAVCLQPDSNVPDTEDVFHDLLFRSGRSVLMVPKDYEGPVDRHVMVAWNGRAEGARAVGSALPLMQNAEKVTVVQLGDIDEERPGIDDICSYLADHGINAHADKRESSGVPVGEQLASIAEDINADLMVIGAYSHSRWREMILGGVTRWLVSNFTRPIFMSH
ncbi:universal stress protein [Kordiimonas marina]|uniref:universal stress protein n=1 Tax=Kordiimonas marina TaxID=2872312 RepID=UPI001FF1147C|nr:universal stress protein [Kordiimonas marina]MCJ9429513.1 universal stress protein [Kordiimonas marina]